MAEGDSIARLAARLDSVTAGCVITACDVRHPRFATADLTGQRILGWAPSIDFETGLAKTIDWYQNNRAIWQKQLWMRDIPIVTRSGKKELH